jgi:hypothetical protein
MNLLLCSFLGVSEESSTAHLAALLKTSFARIKILLCRNVRSRERLIVNYFY